MKLVNSTTFQMCVVVLFIGGVAAGFTDDITWLQWLDKAMEATFVYAAKESVKYGSAAYKERGSE